VRFAQDYQQQRYRSLDQAWVNWREQRLLTQLPTQCQFAQGTVREVPCGDSRCAPLYAHLGSTVMGADVSYAMAHLVAANHVRHGRERWLCADVLALPFSDRVFDGGLCIRLRHHRSSDTARQRLLGALVRVSRRLVIISFYRSTRLHTVARHWRGARGRLALMTFPHVRALAQASGLQLQRVPSLLRCGYAQTFVVWTKTCAAVVVVGRGAEARLVQERSQQRSVPGRWRPWSIQGSRRGPRCTAAPTLWGGHGA
jgi:hypothetical protein